MLGRTLDESHADPDPSPEDERLSWRFTFDFQPLEEAQISVEDNVSVWRSKGPDLQETRAHFGRSHKCPRFQHAGRGFSILKEEAKRGVNVILVSHDDELVQRSDVLFNLKD